MPEYLLGRCASGKILVQCYDAVAQRKSAAQGGQVTPVGYEDVGEAAFGAFGRAVVSTSIYTELLGTAALLFILEVRRTTHLPPLTGAQAAGGVSVKCCVLDGADWTI